MHSCHPFRSASETVPAPETGVRPNEETNTQPPGNPGHIALRITGIEEIPRSRRTRPRPPLQTAHRTPPQTRNRPLQTFPGTDAEALMANASEDLLSISVIACDLADDLHGSRRSVALALSRMADGVRLMVEGTLDHIEVKSAAAKP